MNFKKILLLPSENKLNLVSNPNTEYSEPKIDNVRSKR